VPGTLRLIAFHLRRVALGENVILLADRAWSAVLDVRILRGRGSFRELERWQTNYVRVYAVWAACVVLAFPPPFGYSGCPSRPAGTTPPRSRRSSRAPVPCRARG